MNKIFGMWIFCQCVWDCTHFNMMFCMAFFFQTVLCCVAFLCRPQHIDTRPLSCLYLDNWDQSSTAIAWCHCWLSNSSVKFCCVELLWPILFDSFKNGKFLFCWWLFLPLACVEVLVCPFYQMLTLFQNVLNMLSKHLSCLIVGSSCYTGDTCNPLQVFIHLLYDHGICNTSCQGVNFCSLAFVGGHHWHLHPPSYPSSLEHTYQGLLLFPQRFLLDRKPVSRLYLMQYLLCVDEWPPFRGKILPCPNSDQYQVPF